MAEHHPQNNHSKRETEIVCGALIGLNVVATIEMLSINTLNKRLFVSLFCFALSIPALAWIMMILLTESSEWPILHKNQFHVVLAAGSLLSLTGLAAIFFYFSILVGVVFSAACIIAIVMWFRA